MDRYLFFTFLYDWICESDRLRKYSAKVIRFTNANAIIAENGEAGKIMANGL